MNITLYKDQIQQDYVRSYDEMISHALKMIHIVLRPNRYASVAMSAQYEVSWEEWRKCIHRSLFDHKGRSNYPSILSKDRSDSTRVSVKQIHTAGSNCRKSNGFNGKYIPKSLKYNPYSLPADRQNALNAYQFLLIYEANTYSQNVIRKYLKKYNVSCNPTIENIMRNVFETDYEYNAETGSYPDTEWIVSTIAATTVKTVLENPRVAYNKETDVIYTIVRTDEIALIKNSIKITAL